MRMLLLIGVLVSACCEAQVVQGIYPESGYYWNSRRDGEGVFLEVQGNKAALMLFTYDADGNGMFLLASGDFEQAPEVEQYAAGYYPVRMLRGVLYRTWDGPTLNSYARPMRAEPIGQLVAEFGVGFSFTVHITLDEVPLGAIRTARYIFSRLNFGYEQYGVGELRPAEPCWIDLRGEWVFVDQTDPTRPPWRFNFTTLTIQPDPEDMLCPSDQQHFLIYRDVERGAELRCVKANRPNQPDPIDGRSRYGCELRLEPGGPVQFAFSFMDIGVDRITGSLGSPTGFGVLRSQERVVGLRVQ
jgi:hypothetical protein